jgi:hypothetical protein
MTPDLIARVNAALGRGKGKPAPAAAKLKSQSSPPAPSATLAERIIAADEARRGEFQITTSNTKVLRILAAQEIADGDHIEEVPLPADATARAIIVAAQKAGIA